MPSGTNDEQTNYTHIHKRPTFPMHIKYKQVSRITYRICKWRWQTRHTHATIWDADIHTPASNGEKKSLSRKIVYKPIEIIMKTRMPYDPRHILLATIKIVVNNNTNNHNNKLNQNKHRSNRVLSRHSTHHSHRRWNIQHPIWPLYSACRASTFIQLDENLFDQFVTFDILFFCCCSSRCAVIRLYLGALRCYVWHICMRMPHTNFDKSHCHSILDSSKKEMNVHKLGLWKSKLCRWKCVEQCDRNDDEQHHYQKNWFKL